MSGFSDETRFFYATHSYWHYAGLLKDVRKKKKSITFFQRRYFGPFLFELFARRTERDDHVRTNTRLRKTLCKYLITRTPSICFETVSTAAGLVAGYPYRISVASVGRIRFVRTRVCRTTGASAIVSRRGWRPAAERRPVDDIAAWPTSGGAYDTRNHYYHRHYHYHQYYNTL